MKGGGLAVMNDHASWRGTNASSKATTLTTGAPLARSFHGEEIDAALTRNNMRP